MIKIGSIYKDSWGCKWQVIEYDKSKKKWLMRLYDGFYQSYFSEKEINHLFMILWP